MPASGYFRREAIDTHVLDDQPFGGAGADLRAMPLNIFVLHDVDNFSTTLQNVADYVLCFERYAPEHRYLYHKITDPVTPALRRIRFDVIIIDSTALGLCRYRPVEIWYEFKKRWSFLGDSNAVKLVFPQDDYHMSAILDELFDDWNVDVINSVIPNYHEMLYPRCSKRSRIEVVLTGYVDDNRLHDLDKFALPFEQRRIDLGQRVTFHPHYGGRFSQLKGRLAETAKDRALRAGFQVDVSTRDEDRIFGDNWFRFLGNCRFITGSESGVSVWDRDGTVFDRIESFTELHGDASFEEVEQACFPGEDGKYVFSAISPRLLEAAMTRCCQILIEAPYLGALAPHEHYIPVKPDLSDIDDAIDEMRNAEAARRRIEACYAALIGRPDFRYSRLVKRVMEQVETVMSSRRVDGMAAPQYGRLAAQHRRQLTRRRGYRQLKSNAKRMSKSAAWLVDQHLSQPRDMIRNTLSSVMPKAVARHPKPGTNHARDLVLDSLGAFLPPSVHRAGTELLSRQRKAASSVPMANDTSGKPSSRPLPGT